MLVIDAPDGAAAGDPADGGAVEVDAVTAQWLAALSAELPPARAAAIASKATGLPRALLYRALGHRDPQD